MDKTNSAPLDQSAEPFRGQMPQDAVTEIVVGDVIPTDEREPEPDLPGLEDNPDRDNAITVQILKRICPDEFDTIHESYLGFATKENPNQLPDEEGYLLDPCHDLDACIRRINLLDKDTLLEMYKKPGWNYPDLEHGESQGRVTQAIRHIRSRLKELGENV